MSESVIDIRGEPCGMPALRVEKFILGNESGAPFTVLSDDRFTLETIEALAARRGYACAVSEEATGGWRATFSRTTPA